MRYEYGTFESAHTFQNLVIQSVIMTHINVVWITDGACLRPMTSFVRVPTQAEMEIEFNLQLRSKPKRRSQLTLGSYRKSIGDPSTSNLLDRILTKPCQTELRALVDINITIAYKVTGQNANFPLRGSSEPRILPVTTLIVVVAIEGRYNSSKEALLEVV